MLAPPHTFTSDQLELYLQRIQYAEDATANGTSRLACLQKSIEQDPLSALTQLQQKHIATIPWGNSALHYSQHKTISIHPTAIFEKLVVRRLDGYCMENTNLIYIVLRTLGYQVYPTGGRVSCAVATVNPANEGYLSLGHMILIVTIADHKYMVDVGFGSNGPTRPLLLQENASAILMAPSEMRLIKASLAEFVDKSQKVWVYQARHNPESAWVPHYSFSEVEFLPQDFGMMNFATSNQRSSWFTQALVCTRVILDETDAEPVGLYIMAGKEVKKRVGGHTEVVATVETESDRVQALGKWFGMHFHEHEVEGVRGLPSQIK
ncbi:N-terminal acetyltransferase [Aspergillus nanangensis]|uniref:N-terminal acetyltransferase n=1 Tax=Aspergillus nanangensis TaxID=2582783 RepID=A0AAD4CKB4_ASPNN|nr:N-terminal acetyltransferase [Aspergillus nanangensis]